MTKSKISDQMLTYANRKRVQGDPKRQDSHFLISYFDWLEWVERVAQLEQELDKLKDNLN